MVIIMHGLNGADAATNVSKCAPETVPIQHQSILGRIVQDQVRNFEIAQIVKVRVLNVLFIFSFKDIQKQPTEVFCKNGVL